jgi:hypothetical protein
VRAARAVGLGLGVGVSTGSGWSRSRRCSRTSTRSSAPATCGGSMPRFFTINGVISIVFLCFVAADVLL